MKKGLIEELERQLTQLEDMATLLRKVAPQAATDAQSTFAAAGKNLERMKAEVDGKIDALKKEHGDKLLEVLLARHTTREKRRIHEDLQVTSDEEGVLTEVMRHLGKKRMQVGHCSTWLKLLVRGMVEEKECVSVEELLGSAGKATTMHPYLCTLKGRLEGSGYEIVVIKEGMRRVGYKLRRREERIVR